MAAQRVVSLIASSTEIVYALGLGERLVGRSHMCDFPPQAGRLPALTAPKLNVNTSSKGIDEQVRKLAASGASADALDVEKLKALAPDVVIAPARGSLFSVSLKDVEAALSGRADVKIVALEPNRLEDVFNDIRKIADALEVASAGEALVHRLRSRMHTVAEKAAELPPVSVACLSWLDPLMLAGGWTAELVAMAGGRGVEAERGGEWNALAGSAPEAIVAMPCGFNLMRTRLEMSALASKPEWCRLKAVQSGRTCAADGHQFFNRPGPRLAESLEILAEILHPKEFSFGYQGSGWEPYRL